MRRMVEGAEGKGGCKKEGKKPILNQPIEGRDADKKRKKWVTNTFNRTENLTSTVRGRGRKGQP